MLRSQKAEFDISDEPLAGSGFFGLDGQAAAEATDTEVPSNPLPPAREITARRSDRKRGRRGAMRMAAGGSRIVVLGLLLASALAVTLLGVWDSAPAPEGRPRRADPTEPPRSRAVVSAPHRPSSPDSRPASQATAKLPKGPGGATSVRERAPSAPTRTGPIVRVQPRGPAAVSPRASFRSVEIDPAQREFGFER